MLTSLLSPEAQLLFLAAGEPVNEAAIREILARDLDWVELCRLAEREKALPFLWNRIERIVTGEIPLEAEAHLKKVARVTSFRMSYLEQLVIDSTASLDRAGVGYVLLKGAALACGVYGSFTQRPMLDLDLLVFEGDAERASDVLSSSGWAGNSGIARDADFSRHHHLAPLIDSNGLVSAEVHIALLPRGGPFDVTTNEVLRSSQVISFRQSKVRIPAPPYLLLHTCIHFAWSHLFRTGAWRTFRDVQTMINHYEFDWNDFLELARRHHAETSCFWTMHLARKLVGARVPDEVLSALQPGLPGILIRALERHFTLILLPTGPSCPSVSLRRAMWVAGILPRRSGHGAARPWSAFAVSAVKPETTTHGPQHRPGSMKSSQIRRYWVRYWASVLLASPTPR